jgi:ubiquinone/menaquinone biosynthesis C-methylase UbiE
MSDQVVTPANREAIEAWDGVLFDRFARYRHIFVAGLGAHGNQALRRHPALPGERVLDIGCGFGDTTRQLAALVGADGEVVGVDSSARFIESARAEAGEEGVTNVRFEVADVQAGDLGSGFDMAFARFGTMFFANPVVAMRNVRAALVPDGRLCMVVWRQKLDNEWLHQAEVVVERFLEHNEESDEPTCGPGPFSMAGADTTSDVLIHAGFAEIGFDRQDLSIMIGSDLDEALEVAKALGPAAELIRLAGDLADPVMPDIDAALREALARYDTGDGVWAPASTWAVTARNPG